MEIRVLLVATNQAIKAWKNQEYDQFDALVGENACQIRAFKVALLASKGLTFREETADSIEKVLQEGNMLEIPLTSDELFLVQSYILSSVKIYVPPNAQQPLLGTDKIDYNKIQTFDASVTKSFASALISNLRKRLSLASVEFIQAQAAALEEGSLLKSQVFLHQGYLSCLPMFATYKTLLLMAKKEKIPILMQVSFLDPENKRVLDKEWVLFEGGKSKEIEPEDLSKVACIFEGAVYRDVQDKASWQATISQIGIMDLILAGAADHRQYPDPSKTIAADTEWEMYQKMALEKGCCLDNPTTFFIQHVFASTIGKIKGTA
jgi:hypothetical protein